MRIFLPAGSIINAHFTKLAVGQLLGLLGQMNLALVRKATPVQSELISYVPSYLENTSSAFDTSG